MLTTTAEQVDLAVIDSADPEETGPIEVDVEVDVDYQGVNNDLFDRRIALKEQVKRLAVSSAKDAGNQLRRAELELDGVNTEIVKANMGLVRSYVRRFTSKSSIQDSEDFEGAALVGLMRAVDSYDPKLGRFSTWAYRSIQRECLRAVRSADFANMTATDFERRPEILRAVASLQADDASYQPSHEEVALLANVTVEQVRRVLDAPTVESLHRPIGDESGGGELGDLFADDTVDIESEVIRKHQVAALTRFGLGVLDRREMYVVARRFGLDGEPEQKLNEIGRTLGLSREGVRQIESKALSKLNHPRTLRRLVREGRD